MLNIIKVNIIKTIYINFKTQPFNIAIKFPIFVYGKLVIPVLKGELKINSEVKTGMIRIGYKYLDMVPAAFLPTQLYILEGKIIFNGPCVISGGVSLYSYKSILNIGKNCVVGGGCIVKSLDQITIGDNTRIAFEAIIFDSNVHYVKNIETGEIAKNKAPIIIGKNCWINSRSFVGKGSKLPNYTIVAGSSFISKDYTNFGDNIFLAGSPAKPIGGKVQRIFSMQEEGRLNGYFEDNKEKLSSSNPIGIFEDRNDYFEKG